MYHLAHIKLDILQSAEVYEFVKRDFDEISSVVKNEASAVVSSTASVVKETLQVRCLIDNYCEVFKQSFSVYNFRFNVYMFLYY